MKIYIIRHGDALSTGEHPLSERGVRESRQTAQFLKRLGARPDWILHSPLLRARQTAELLNEPFNLPQDKVISTDNLLPSARIELLVKEIKGLVKDNEEEVFLTGHLPFLGELLCYIICGEPIKEIPIKKSGVALIEVRAGETWKGKGRLLYFLSPQIL